MKILAIAGSLRAESYNLQLAQAAKEALKETHPEVAFSILEWSSVPLFNEDVEFPAPDSVTHVRHEVAEADGIWLFSPEYNHSIPGPLKNLLDWLSRPLGSSEPQVLLGKPIALAGASPGAGGTLQAQDHLVTMLSFLRADIMNYPRLAIPHITKQADQGILKLTDSAPYLSRQADAFVQYIRDR